MALTCFQAGLFPFLSSLPFHTGALSVSGALLAEVRARMRKLSLLLVMPVSLAD